MIGKAKLTFSKILRIILFSFREYREDQLYLQASALTLYSLFSIVPILALAFAIAKGFDLQGILEREILKALQPHQEVATHLIEFSQNLLNKAKGGVIAGVGIATLLWAVIKLLSNVEEAFNHIWGISKGRTWGRRFSDYLSLALICPILLIVANGAMIVLSQKAYLLGRFSGVVSFFLGLTPIIAMSLLLAFLYRFMPNTKVPLKAVGIAGGLSGLAYILFQNLYLFFQIKIADYSPIYGSFAAFPLFLIWLQMSWLIILTGAEIAYSIQNMSSKDSDENIEDSPEIDYKIVALAVMETVSDRFIKNKPPMTFHQLLETLEVPPKLLRKVVGRLMHIKLLVETTYGDEEIYLPAKDPHSITSALVWLKLEQEGTSHLNSDKRPPLSSLEKEMIKTIQGFSP